MAVRGSGGVQRRQVILCGRIIQHPAGTECGGDGAIGDAVANIAERRVRIALGVDAERVLDLVRHGVHPSLVAAIGVVGDLEITAPRGDLIGLSPELLGFLRVVFQIGGTLQVLGIFRNQR